MCWSGLACKSGEDTFFPTLMKVLAGGRLGPGHGGGAERTGSGWGFSQAVLGDGRRGVSVSETTMPSDSKWYCTKQGAQGWQPRPELSLG